MRTKRVISAIVITCMVTCITISVLLVVLLGWRGAALAAALGVALVVPYDRWIRRWHASWGATGDEVIRSMPGDAIIDNAASTTRAIGIAADPAQIWPWLVQIGYGRAGWYSYDWIDNDGKPSADRIVSELQILKIGDTIEMLPGFGPELIEIKPGNYFVAGDEESGTWCLALYPTDRGCRLVSRWRQAWSPHGLAGRFFVLISDPGAFIMEQKMLRGIKKRAESDAQPLPPTVSPDDSGNNIKRAREGRSRARQEVLR